MHMLFSFSSPQASIIGLLVAAGANPNQCQHNGTGFTPMHSAALRGYTDTIRELATWGAHVNVTDFTRRSPLMIAARFGFLDIIRLLLDLNVNVNATDWHGTTALHDATETCQIAVMRCSSCTCKSYNDDDLTAA